MNYLLDTCVLSEFTRHQPEERVVAWLDAIEEEKLFISVITVGEIQRGIERLPDSHRKTEFLIWMNNGLLTRFAQRTVTIDAQTMLIQESLVVRLEAAGQRVGVMDSLIIASALQNNLIVATRNVADYLPGGVQVINPWE
jgi:predicted nucleic acid-binding protein